MKKISHIASWGGGKEEVTGKERKKKGILDFLISSKLGSDFGRTLGRSVKKGLISNMPFIQFFPLPLSPLKYSERNVFLSERVSWGDLMGFGSLQAQNNVLLERQGRYKMGFLGRALKCQIMLTCFYLVSAFRFCTCQTTLCKAGRMFDQICKFRYAFIKRAHTNSIDLFLSVD